MKFDHRTTLEDLHLTKMGHAIVMRLDDPREAALVAIIRTDYKRRATRLFVARPTRDHMNYECAWCREVVAMDPIPTRHISTQARVLWGGHYERELLKAERAYPALVSQLREAFTKGEHLPYTPPDRFVATDDDYARRRRKRSK